MRRKGQRGTESRENPETEPSNLDPFESFDNSKGQRKVTSLDDDSERLISFCFNININCNCVFQLIVLIKWSLQWYPTQTSNPNMKIGFKGEILRTHHGQKNPMVTNVYWPNFSS